MKRYILVLSLAVFFVSWASIGTAQWATTVGGWEYDVVNTVVSTWDGGLIAAGGTQSFNSGGSRYAWLFKLDGGGNVQWEYSFEGADSIVDMALAPDGLNVVAVTGSWVLKFNTSVGIVWQKEVGASDDFYINSVTVDAAGNSILAGVIKTEPNGDIWVVNIDLPMVGR